MAKRKGSGGYLTPGEQVAGTVLLVLYLLVLPWAVPMLFRLVGHLLGVTIADSVRGTLYYGGLTAAVLVIFHRFLWRTCGNLTADPGAACREWVMGLVTLYGLNELTYRLGHLLLGAKADLNAAPLTGIGMPLLLTVLLVPLVEEMLFRGLVFGGLKGKGPAVAYGVSCLLFAALRMWQLCGTMDFVLLLQFLIPGAVLCRVYENSGTLWTPFAVHAVFNLLAVWSAR